MGKIQTAFFVKRPRRLEDLMVPHAIERERRYEIVKVVKLRKIEYENFVTDMLVDRQFLEDNAVLCSKEGAVIHCLKITFNGADESILVVPDKSWVEIAAINQEKD